MTAKRKPKYSRLTTVPFGGFYNSWHDDMFDRAFTGLFQTIDGDERPELESAAFDYVNWHKSQEAYAKAYVENVAHKFGIMMLFEEMRSPREYNFETDRLFACIPMMEIRRLRKVTDPEILDAVVKENLTSRDGFSSFYPNDVAEWPDITEWDVNHVGQLVQAYIRQENGGKDMDSYQETELMEHERDNGYIDDWIIQFADKGIERILSIAAYLREREERKYRTLAPPPTTG